jgi:hypothetical protein
VACVPVNPSARDLVGRWKVTGGCGYDVLIEELNLKDDGTYVHSIQFHWGGRADGSGVWRVIPKTERFVGAKVVLENALVGCGSNYRIWPPLRFRRELEAEWEWGRLVLHLNPDTNPFMRQ